MKDLPGMMPMVERARQNMQTQQPQQPRPTHMRGQATPRGQAPRPDPVTTGAWQPPMVVTPPPQAPTLPAQTGLLISTPQPPPGLGAPQEGYEWRPGNMGYGQYIDPTGQYHKKQWESFISNPDNWEQVPISTKPPVGMGGGLPGLLDQYNAVAQPSAPPTYTPDQVQTNIQQMQDAFIGNQQTPAPQFQMIENVMQQIQQNEPQLQAVLGDGYGQFKESLTTLFQPLRQQQGRSILNMLAEIYRGRSNGTA